MGEGVAMPGDLGTVQDRSFRSPNFRVQNGTEMPEAKIVYETYGRLASDGGNVVLITHGHTSSHHAAGRNPQTVIYRAGGMV
jgi:homoserine O-acetyltransferase/O-succinyltransferase